MLYKDIMKDFSAACRTLEFYKITEMLASMCATSGGASLCRSLQPSSDIDEVRIRQTQTTDAKSMTASAGSPSFGGVADITACADRAGKGASLSARELIEVGDLLNVTARLCSYADGKSAGSLEELFSRLVPNKNVENRIKRAILSEDTIADDASVRLAEIRRSIRNANSRIRDILQKYITDNSYSKILQDNIVTMRNGRFVIPVKSEHKNEIKGLVHDTSSSGATLFIEPLSVVEQNNALRELESAQAKEIERILAELSALVGGISTTLIYNYLTITELAFIFAKAELSWKMKAVEPFLSENGRTELSGARHPLIDPSKVVPIDIRIGVDFDSLIITGPNTGGKTVCLKTLGLLTLMAQAGLHIPCRDGSSVRVFESVHADIGDEQSIEQSLSTFSAHMTNIVSILSGADSRSLVLFDELGAGTDPVEGAALAVAVTEKVRSLGAVCAATTHYSEMKMYALETPGVCNAACEFDVKTLAPTYKLIIGAPGKSNAFAISARLGLEKDVIDRAKSLIDKDNRRFDNVLGRLEATRQQAQSAKEKADELKHRYEELMDQAEKDAKSMREAAQKELENAKSKALGIVESARATSNFVFEELDKAKKASEKSRNYDGLEQARANIRKAMKKAGDDLDPVSEKKDENYVFPRELRKGDEVILVNLDRRGTLIDAPDSKGNVSVKTGLVTTKTNIKNLRLCEDSESSAKKNAEKQQRMIQGMAASFRTEIDLRGKTGEEAWEEVDRYIDNALLVGAHTVRLIHGKGTGALRKYLWEALRTDKRVSSYRIGTYGEGDSGVTVLELS